MCRYRFYIGRPNGDRKRHSDQERQTIIGVTSSTDTILHVRRISSPSVQIPENL